MLVIDVVPKDIHYLLDFSGNDLTKLKTIMDNMEFRCDSTNPDHVLANEYLHDVLYPTVSQLIKEVEESGS